MSDMTIHAVAEQGAIEGVPATKNSDLPLLVIEDEASVQTFLCAALKKHGYKTVLTSSCNEGLELLKKNNFRGVISDLRLPGDVNAAGLHSWIRTHRPQLLSRILFITGDLSGEVAAQVLLQTGAPCIEKPFRVAELITAVNRVLES